MKSDWNSKIFQLKTNFVFFEKPDGFYEKKGVKRGFIFFKGGKNLLYNAYQMMFFPRNVFSSLIASAIVKFFLQKNRKFLKVEK